MYVDVRMWYVYLSVQSPLLLGTSCYLSPLLVGTSPGIQSPLLPVTNRLYQSPLLPGSRWPSTRYCSWPGTGYDPVVHRYTYLTGYTRYLSPSWVIVQGSGMHGAATKRGKDVAGHTYAPSVMVWWDMSYYGTTKIHFCRQKVKIDKKVYRRILKEIVEPFQDTLFEGSDYYFQPDSAPAHKMKEVQLWLMEKFLISSRLTSVHLGAWPQSVGPLVMKLSEGYCVCLLTHQFGHFDGEYC